MFLNSIIFNDFYPVDQYRFKLMITDILTYLESSFICFVLAIETKLNSLYYTHAACQCIASI